MCPEKYVDMPSDLEAAFRQFFETGSPEAKEEVLKIGRELAYYYADIYSPGQADNALREAAGDGFLQALERYEPKRDVSFSFYATHCIISEIRQELRSKNIFKVPDWLKRLQEDVMNATEALAKEKANLPTLKEISSKVNIVELGITETMQAGSIPLQGINLASIKNLRHETFKMPIEDVIIIRKSLDRLSNIQKKVLSLISINLKELSMAIEEEESALTQTHAQYMRVVEEGTANNEIKETINSFKMNFPDQYVEEEVLRYFEVLSDEYGLRLTEVRCTGKPEKKDKQEYIQVPLDIRLEGRYRGLLQLLDHLRNSEKAFSVKRVRTMRNEKIPARISISIEVNTYYVNIVVN